MKVDPDVNNPGEGGHSLFAGRYDGRGWVSFSMSRNNVNYATHVVDTEQRIRMGRRCSNVFYRNEGNLVDSWAVNIRTSYIGRGRTESTWAIWRVAQLLRLTVIITRLNRCGFIINEKDTYCA